MIKINLVAEVAAPAAARRARREVSLGVKQGDLILLVMLALSFVVVGGNWYLLSSKRTNLQNQQQELQAERDKLQVYIDKVKELEVKRDALKHKIEIIDKLKENQHGPVRIMDEVSRALPDLVWLTTMTVANNVVTLEGKAMDENAVANYIANLDASPFFQEPTLLDLSRAGKDVFNFRLTCVFTYKPPQIKSSTDAGGGGQ
jgi:type IV pilus assembly protein PilN